MIRILLIRHGSTDLMGHVLYGRMPGVHLNDEGNRQVRSLAARLTQEYELSKIVSSPLERALETARPIAEIQGRTLLIDEQITEIDVGSWTGKTFEELGVLEEWKSYNRQRSLYRPPGGESMLQTQARARQSLADHTGSKAGGTVAFITHGDVIRALLILLLGLPLDYIHRLEISPACLTEVELGDSSPIIKRMNQRY
jgi:probable phosphoglycerate mutase